MAHICIVSEQNEADKRGYQKIKFHRVYEIFSSCLYEVKKTGE